ncbi:transposase [Candidatus Latescibacterota bacterium]
MMKYHGASPGRNTTTRSGGHAMPDSPTLRFKGIHSENSGRGGGRWERGRSWSAVFRELKERGIHGVSYVVSDDHTELTKAIACQFQGAIWQRCQVHFIRNVLSNVPKKDRGRILAHLRSVSGNL